ncbi:hypothetical protein JXB31_02470 [Candidatus Woesearchaeota archaeon]|nr:hypothetical protein [Candidatus Woesearchaeota archaeon]
MRAKRGQAGTSTLNKVILTVIVLLVLVSFFSGALKIFEKTVSDEQCRLSVLAQSKDVFGLKIVTLNCPRHNIKVTEKDAKIRNAKGNYDTYISFNTLLTKEPEQFYKLVANEMADCWFKMGEGMVDVFDQDVLMKNRATCLICSHISFDVDAGAKGIDLGSSDGFLEYLNTHNYTKNSYDVNYSKYMLMDYPAQFAGALTQLYYSADKSIYIHGFDNNTQLSTNDEYVVFFKAMKYSKANEQFGNMFKAIINNDDNFMRMEDTYFIFFARPENVPEVCSVLVN